MFKVRAKMNTKNLKAKVKTANFESMGEAARLIRGFARRSIKTRKASASAGQPVTFRGKAGRKQFRHKGKVVSGKRAKILKSTGAFVTEKQIAGDKSGAVKNSILFNVNKNKSMAVIGPVRSRVKNIGNLHEFGGRFKGRTYSARPYMAPALQQNLDRIPKAWRSSI